MIQRFHLHIAEEYNEPLGEDCTRHLRCKICGELMKVVGCHVELQEEEIDT